MPQHVRILLQWHDSRHYCILYSKLSGNTLILIPPHPTHYVCTACYPNRRPESLSLHSHTQHRPCLLLLIPKHKHKQTQCPLLPTSPFTALLCPQLTCSLDVSVWAVPSACPLPWSAAATQTHHMTPWTRNGLTRCSHLVSLYILLTVVL